ncbi:hypothetical protein B0H11DRAFT_1921928 [Mycena galericulata]|nr:hypothetical protein B0H11DRAFT_1921928 [Mycena galericulata]
MQRLTGSQSLIAYMSAYVDPCEHVDDSPMNGKEYPPTESRRDSETPTVEAAVAMRIAWPRPRRAHRIQKKFESKDVVNVYVRMERETARHRSRAKRGKNEPDPRLRRRMNPQRRRGLEFQLESSRRSQNARIEIGLRRAHVRVRTTEGARKEGRTEKSNSGSKFREYVERGRDYLELKTPRTEPTDQREQPETKDIRDERVQIPKGRNVAMLACKERKYTVIFVHCGISSQGRLRNVDERETTDERHRAAVRGWYACLDARCYDDARQAVFEEHREIFQGGYRRVRDH